MQLGWFVLFFERPAGNWWSLRHLGACGHRVVTPDLDGGTGGDTAWFYKLADVPQVGAQWVQFIIHHETRRVEVVGERRTICTVWLFGVIKQRVKWLHNHPSLSTQITGERVSFSFDQNTQPLRREQLHYSSGDKPEQTHRESLKPDREKNLPSESRNRDGAN